MDANISEAKIHLSKLIHMIKAGREDTIWICRYSNRVVKLIGSAKSNASKRIGIAKDKLKTPNDLDQDQDKIIALLRDGGL